MLFIRIMRDYFDDEEEFFEEEENTIIRRKMENEEKERRDFVKYCNDAYEVIKHSPDSIIDGEDSPVKKETLINAINRMSALFIIEEEYEKCTYLKKFMENRIPGETFEPRIEEVKKFLGK